MAELSCNELMIIGGRGTDGPKGDGYVLDTRKMRLKNVILDTKESIKFSAFEN